MGGESQADPWPPDATVRFRAADSSAAGAICCLDDQDGPDYVSRLWYPLPGWRSDCWLRSQWPGWRHSLPVRRRPGAFAQGPPPTGRTRPKDVVRDRQVSERQKCEPTFAGLSVEEHLPRHSPC